MLRRRHQHILILLLFTAGILLPSDGQPAAEEAGRWMMVQPNVGISAMHMQLLHTDVVVMFDRTKFGPSKLLLPADQCTGDDCTAHSILYSSLSNTFRPLTLHTDTWCSSGSALPNGTLLQTGGFDSGDRVVRLFSPADPSSDWSELPYYLAVRRWYATDQLLPDGRVLIVGGRRQFSYEFFPSSGGVVSFPFLQETHDEAENNLYPFLHLLPDGRLFVFANTRAVLLDYNLNQVVRRYPPIPDYHPRNYPSSGSSVLLSLRLDQARDVKSEVLICGGAPPGSFQRASAGEFVKALTTCGRIVVTDPNPTWEMEEMPIGRVMGDMLLLPTGDVLIINGAGSGTAGWELARDPVLTPVLYRPEQIAGRRFLTLRASTVPRMYHSSAVVLSDGRVLVGGSNPHVYYNFTGVLFPTELSLESFSPPYQSARKAVLRPAVVSVVPAEAVGYGQLVTVEFRVPVVFPRLDVAVTLLFPSFTTHSLAMNQRHLVLRVANTTAVSSTTHRVSVVAPPSSAVAPPGYYMMFVVHGGVPSRGKWIKIQ